MNRARLTELADIIEAAPPERFSMSNFVQDPDDAEPDVFGGKKWDDWYARQIVRPKEWAECGTAGCIAGWAVGVYGDKRRKYHDDNIEHVARDLLGLDSCAANDLFYGAWADENMADITRQQAAAQLRHLAARTS